MNNIPKVKMGIVAVSRDCFPESLSVNKMVATVRMNVDEIGKAMANSMIDCLKGTLVLDENRMTFADASLLYTLLDETNYKNYND